MQVIDVDSFNNIHKTLDFVKLKFVINYKFVCFVDKQKTLLKNIVDFYN